MVMFQNLRWKALHHVWQFTLQSTEQSMWIHTNGSNESKGSDVLVNKAFEKRNSSGGSKLSSFFHPIWHRFVVSSRFAWTSHSSEIPREETCNLERKTEIQTSTARCAISRIRLFSCDALNWKSFELFCGAFFMMIKKRIFSSRFLTFVLLLAYLSQFSQLFWWWGDKCFDKHTLRVWGERRQFVSLIYWNVKEMCFAPLFSVTLSVCSKKKTTREQNSKHNINQPEIRESLLFDSLQFCSFYLR